MESPLHSGIMTATSPAAIAPVMRRAIAVFLLALVALPAGAPAGLDAPGGGPERAPDHRLQAGAGRVSHHGGDRRPGHPEPQRPLRDRGGHPNRRPGRLLRAVRAPADRVLRAPQRVRRRQRPGGAARHEPAGAAGHAREPRLHPDRERGDPAHRGDRLDGHAGDDPPVTGPPPLIPLQDLFGNPERALPKPSPDRARLAWLAPDDGRLNVWVAPIDDDSPNSARPVTRDRERG